jgi:hypothetical protein
MPTGEQVSRLPVTKPEEDVSASLPPWASDNELAWFSSCVRNICEFSHSQTVAQPVDIALANLQKLAALIEQLACAMTRRTPVSGIILLEFFALPDVWSAGRSSCDHCDFAGIGHGDRVNLRSAKWHWRIAARTQQDCDTECRDFIENSHAFPPPSGLTHTLGVGTIASDTIFILVKVSQ